MDERALDAVVTAVAYARPNLVDAWEAATVVESLGYTDARVRRELGVEDTQALGELVFERLAQRPLSAASAPEDIAASLPRLPSSELAGVTFVPPLAWLTFVMATRATADGAFSVGTSPVAYALMFSFIAVGGFMYAIARRTRFYVALEQPAVARSVSAYLVRAGALAALGVAALVLALGWALELAAWPYLILSADELLALCALWLVCGFLAGMGGALPRLFQQRSGRPAAVPLPRLSVVLYSVMPLVLYGSAYFSVVFAERLFARSPNDRIALDMAILTTLCASGAVASVHRWFTGRLSQMVQQQRQSDSPEIRTAARRLHRRALAAAAAAFVVIAAVVGTAAVLLDDSGQSMGLLVSADVGYLLITLGAVNASLLLGILNRPWSAVAAFLAAVAVSLAAHGASSWTGGQWPAGAAVSASGIVVLLMSTVAVWRSLRRVDHAVAVAA